MRKDLNAKNTKDSKDAKNTFFQLTLDESFRAEAWNRLVGGLPGAHLLQTHEWGQVKGRFGWRPLYAVWREGEQARAAALLLERVVRLPLLGGLRVLYAPRGPLLDWGDAGLRRSVLDDLVGLARRRAAIFVKIDPDVALGYGRPDDSDPAGDDPCGLAAAHALRQAGWRFSDEQIQFRNTALLDLARSADELLAAMKQKTRYNIRLAERKGVQIREGISQDFPALHRLYMETAARDDFVIRNEAYYLDLWNTMDAAGLALPLIAEVDGSPAAAVMLFHFAGRAWYMQGMSGAEHREKMPNHLLQWQAILRLKALGVRTYDLWGAPDEFVESDPLWGVFRFKEGLGAQVVRGLGAWDFPVRPLLYRLYMQALPRLLDVMRRRGKQRTQRMVGG